MWETHRHLIYLSGAYRLPTIVQFTTRTASLSRAPGTIRALKQEILVLLTLHELVGLLAANVESTVRELRRSFYHDTFADTRQAGSTSASMDEQTNSWFCQSRPEASLNTRLFQP